MKPNDLESRRPTFFLIGLIASLSLTLMAFEWQTPKKNFDLPSDLPEEIIKIEPDLLHSFVIEQPPSAEVVQTQSATRKPSNRFEIVDDHVLTKLKTATTPTRLQTSLKLNKPKRPLDQRLDNSGVAPRGIRGLAPHELPYLRACGHIKDDIERFQCTQLELKKHVVNKFRMPSIDQVAQLPERVSVTFTIDPYGNIKDVTPNKEYAEALTHELERVISSLPEMVPAAVGGNRVAVRFELPLHLQRK